MLCPDEFMSMRKGAFHFCKKTPALVHRIACGTLRERSYTDKTHGGGFQIPKVLAGGREFV